MRWKAALILMIFCLPITIYNYSFPTANPVVKANYSNTHVTQEGTVVNITIFYEETARTGIPYVVNITITLISLGSDVKDIHDIEVSVMAEVSGKLFSPYTTTSSKLGTLTNVLNSTNATLYWVPDSFLLQLTSGQSVNATLKYRLIFRENKELAPDPINEFVSFFGYATVYFEKESWLALVFYTVIGAVVLLVLLLTYFVLRRRRKVKKKGEQQKAEEKRETIIIKEKVMIRCPYCGALAEQGTKTCPSCGAKI